MRPAVLLLVTISCTSGGGMPADGGTGGGGGAGGGMQAAFELSVVEAARTSATDLDLVVDSAQERAGLAYFSDEGDGGFALKYVEWKDGALGTPEVVDRVQRVVGVSIDFHPTTHEPAIAYLGGGSDGSLFWFQSDSVYSTRAAGTWTRTTVATMSGQVDCGNPVSASGFAVGLESALRYDSAGVPWVCYRDIHNAQNDIDYTGANIECWHGGTPECAKAGGSINKDGSGGHLRMVMVNDQPVLAYDHMGTATGDGTGTTVLQRTSAGWQPPENSLGSKGAGPSLAYDSMEGIAVAALNADTGELDYGKGPSFTADPIFGAGTGGFFPALAIDSVTHAPVVAFGICSARTGVMFSACDASELKLATRAAQWNMQSVSKDFPASVRLGILPSGRRMIAYRDTSSGALKVAISR